jgi:pimeloyl-ACP methyl ester carboxylesterase
MSRHMHQSSLTRLSELGTSTTLAAASASISIALGGQTSARERPLIEYILHGHGPSKVLALHSLFSDGRSFQALMAAFDPDRWTVAMIDFRGYGASAAVAGPFNLAIGASDALAVADSLGWDRFAVLGHSMGGKSALRLAADAPSRVTRIVGLSPIWAGGGLYNATQIAFLRTSIQSVDARQTIMTNTTGNRLPKYWYRRTAEESAAGSRPDAYAGYVESLISDDYETASAALEQPVLVIAGAYDPGNVDMARTHWLPKLKHAELMVLPECGHWGLVEMPLFVGASVETFLSKT